MPLLAIALLSLAMTQDPAKPKQEPEYDMKVVQLAFLVTSEKAPEVSKEEVDKLQANHLKFLEGLYNERKAILIGPLREAGKLRGIVVLDTTKKEEAEALLKSDPYVADGHMAVEIHPWFTARNIPLKAPKFMDIEPMWFGLLKRAPNAAAISKEEAEAIQAGHMANIQKMASLNELVLAGPMAETGDLRGIFIFRGSPKEKILELASQDPAIAKGRLTLDLYQWFTAKGTFPPPKA